MMQGSYSMLIQEAGLRRGKVLAAADQFAQLVGGVVETLVGQSVSAKGLLKQGSETISEPVVRRIPLPPSIIANAEPFRHGDWRKEPYPTRQNHLTRLLLAYDWSYVFPTSCCYNCVQPTARCSTAVVCVKQRKYLPVRVTAKADTCVLCMYWAGLSNIRVTCLTTLCSHTFSLRIL